MWQTSSTCFKGCISSSSLCARGMSLTCSSIEQEEVDKPQTPTELIVSSMQLPRKRMTKKRWSWNLWVEVTAIPLTWQMDNWNVTMKHLCCVFWPVNGCFALHLLVKINFFRAFSLFSVLNKKHVFRSST